MSPLNSLMFVNILLSKSLQSSQENEQQILPCLLFYLSVFIPRPTSGVVASLQTFVRLSTFSFSEHISETGDSLLSYCTHTHHFGGVGVHFNVCDV